MDGLKLTPYRDAASISLPQQAPATSETRILTRATTWVSRFLIISGLLIVLARTVAYFRSPASYAGDSAASVEFAQSPWTTAHHYIPATVTPPLESVDSTPDLVSDTSPTTRTSLSESSSTNRPYPPPSQPTQTPTFSSVRKAIIIASVQSEDTTWVEQGFPDWEKDIYRVDNSSAELTVKHNEGHEASVYLSYVIDNYDDLPHIMVFSHANRYQWHNDDPMYDGVNTIRNLQLEHVRAEGYVSLRCHWHDGCPVSVMPDKNFEENIFQVERTMYEAYEILFPGKRVPEVLGSTCCAQFAVSREAVLRRGRDEYKRMRRWLWSTTDDKSHVPDVAHSDLTDFKFGRVFEHVWHVIFGQDDVYCPDAETCYCKTYGLCDLKCPKASDGQAEKCLGRYKELSFSTGIDDATWPGEGQGVDGRPVDGWWTEFYPPELYDGFALRENSTN